jgi:F0F1-type ATP synthase membrane subunit b/b'
MSEPRELEVKAKTLEGEARALVVASEEDYRNADRFGRAAKALLAEIDAAFDPIIEQAHRTHKQAIEQKKKQAEPVETVKRIVAAKMGEWYRAEQARIAEERRKAEAEARRRADEEALRVAEELAAAGMNEAAEVALCEPVVERVVVQEAPKLEGVSYRETWSAEILDFDALVRAVAGGEASSAYLLPNTVALNADARTHKSALKVPGVRVRSELIQARRA